MNIPALLLIAMLVADSIFRLLRPSNPCMYQRIASGRPFSSRKRRMQQIGRCPYLFTQLLNQFPAVSNPFGKLWIVPYTLTDVSKTHAQGR